MNKKLIVFLLVSLLLISLVSAMGYFNYVRLWKSQRPNHFTASGGYTGSIKVGNQVQCGLEGQRCCALPSGRLGCFKVSDRIVMCEPDGFCHRVR